MSISFDPSAGLIGIAATIYGPTGDRTVQLALDTGATLTTVNTVILAALGYDPGASATRIQITTGSGIELAQQVTVHRIGALNQERTTFPIVAHTLPPSASVDGLLGLDFLRGCELSIDFRAGQITLL